MHADSPAVDDLRFVQRPLMDDFLDLVVPLGHPLAGRGPVELAAVSGEDWTTLPTTRIASSRRCAPPPVLHRAGALLDEWPAVPAGIGHGMGCIWCSG
ncbi:hypothetical protein ITI46_19565 [Streptomyces oryzae]|uniref:LysR substrate-binding domain-containing protein n=1 Tax=Streptomyces oryzae TaxID=1434886 RepID=A0ABS3XEM8_9ACTN|nr:hypothetical protein [Streptomyces oryzae]